jgi:hypothetical protein
MRLLCRAVEEVNAGTNLISISMKKGLFTDEGKENAGFIRGTPFFI